MRECSVPGLRASVPIVQSCTIPSTTSSLRAIGQHMALSAFDDKTKKPKAHELKKVLGRASIHWNGLTTHIADSGPVDEAWNFAGANWGWSLQLKRKKRTILYMTPCTGHFVVGFALGKKAVEAAHHGKLPKSLLETIDASKRYVEGRAVRFEIRNKQDLENAKLLAAIKIAT